MGAQGVSMRIDSSGNIGTACKAADIEGGSKAPTIEIT